MSAHAPQHVGAFEQAAVHGGLRRPVLFYSGAAPASEDGVSNTEGGACREGNAGPGLKATGAYCPAHPNLGAARRHHGRSHRRGSGRGSGSGSGVATPTRQHLAGDSVVRPLVLVEPVRVTAVHLEDGLGVFLEAKMAAVKIFLSMRCLRERNGGSEGQRYPGHDSTAIHLNLLTIPESVTSTCFTPLHTPLKPVGTGRTVQVAFWTLS
ncbi:hypothetical protein GPZ77_32675 [Streptomyces sp. QHH-9511]|uniref:hypothetical protein n=1 Tax=Streptomyces sp. QHH-9511 TaxID=2684468 RepID=UPI001317BC04|nr:hypothetical protein GPZ77_32675 [Streptomyces sp. QHH-9511]